MSVRHPGATQVGGVDKTAVALAWLYTLREHLPDGQLYTDPGPYGSASMALCH